jgi:hypothetical protein
METKRSQTATEYLIILAVVIIIALVVVNTLGGFPGIGANNNKKVSDYKLQSDTVGVESYSIGANSSLFKLKNNYFDTITVTEFRVNQQSNLTCNSSNTNPSLPIVLNVGQSMIVNCSVVNSSSYTITNRQVPVVGILFTDSVTSNRFAGNAQSYGAVSLSGTSGQSGCVVTGGNITIVNGYKIHTFLSNGTLNITSGSCVAEVLVVAGGGAGGGNGAPGGGGGAGGLIYNSSYNLNLSNYSIVVGNGGLAGYNGGNSSFGSLVAIGGGHGAMYSGSRTTGGSGAGGGYSTSAGAAGTAGQGNNGGNGLGTSVLPLGAGGGGGAGTVGQAATANPSGKSGDGGIGLNYSISGVNTYYAGGGGAGVTAQGSTQGFGGLGGGGNGTSVQNAVGGSAIANTGGGGGGSHNAAGGSGGSGIVIVRYALTGGSIPNCADGQILCNGTIYSNCSNGNWVNNGNVDGLCGYSAPGNITSLRTGLVGYWPLDGNVSDSSGSNKGGANNGATYTISGKVGGAYSFDGSTTLINTNLTMPTTNFSISIWYNTSDNGGSYTHRPFGSGDSCCGSHGLDYTVNNGGGRATVIFRNNGASYDFDCGSSPSINIWENLILAVSSTTGTTCYRNSVSSGSNSNAKSISTGGLTFKMGSAGDTGGVFSGKMDEVSVWNRSLNSTEVLQLYNNGTGLSLSLSGAQTPVCAAGQTSCNVTNYLTCSNGSWFNNGNITGYCGYAPPGNVTQLRQNLIEYYHFDGNVTDYSGYGRNASWSGASSYVSGKIGQSANLNGWDSFIWLPSNYIPNSNVTLSMWIKPYILRDALIVERGPTAGCDGLLFMLGEGGDTSSRLRFDYGCSDYSLHSNNSLTINSWNHVAITQDAAGYSKIYINGQFEAGESQGIHTNTNIQSLGGGYGGGTYVGTWNLNGTVDEFAAWNRVLNDTEIAQMYNGGNGLSLVP